MFKNEIETSNVIHRLLIGGLNITEGNLQTEVLR